MIKICLLEVFCGVFAIFERLWLSMFAIAVLCLAPTARSNFPLMHYYWSSRAWIVFCVKQAPQVPFFVRLWRLQESWQRLAISLGFPPNWAAVQAGMVRASWWSPYPVGLGYAYRWVCHGLMLANLFGNAGFVFGNLFSSILLMWAEIWSGPSPSYITGWVGLVPGEVLNCWSWKDLSLFSKIEKGQCYCGLCSGNSLFSTSWASPSPCQPKAVHRCCNNTSVAWGKQLWTFYVSDVHNVSCVNQVW